MRGLRLLLRRYERSKQKHIWVARVHIDWRLALDILKALLTPVIAGVTAYIAWQQWKTNELKIKLDRYERRLRVYEEVKKILAIITRDAKVAEKDLLQFRINTSEADFLFDQDVPKYLDDIYRHGCKLMQRNTEYADARGQELDGYNNDVVVQDRHEQLKWLTEQFTHAKKLFKPYLDISQ